MTTTAKIGAFFVVVLVALAILILRIEDIHFGKKARTNTVDAHFKDVAGLDDKSAVRIAGVRIGKVDGITLRPDGTAVIHLALDAGVELREGASAQIRSLGMLGDKYVELQPGAPGAPRLAQGALLDGVSSTGFDDLTKMASDIGKDLKELSSALAGSMGGKQGEEKINRIVDNIGALAEALKDLVEHNRGNVDATLANLKEFSGQMRETLARMDRILDENRATFKSTVSNADQISEKLKTTADNLNSITGKIDTGQGTIGKLLNDDETHKNLNDALTSVKTGVESLNQTLSRMNRIQLDLGFRAEYASRNGDGKYWFTLDAIPRDNKFYRLEIGATPKGMRQNIDETTTVTFPNGSEQTIHTTGERYVDQLLLSLQLGYRLKDTILRAGLIESRGGAAIEQTFKADSYRLAGEVWDFSRDNYRGHIKLYGRWNASPNLYVTGGVDELINPGLRSPFIGGGIRWKDEDLKGLIGSIPVPKEVAESPRPSSPVPRAGRRARSGSGAALECGGWNTLTEEREAPRAAAAGAGVAASAVRLSDVAAAEVPRLPTGMTDVDRVLGGGLVPGSIVLLGGEPGIGKSTLLLQVASHLSDRIGEVLYVSAEESAQQIRMRAVRLGVAAPGLFLLAETNLDTILETARAGRYAAVVVDSIQTIASPGAQAAAGSVTQVRECASRLQAFAKTSGVPVFLIGHVTKDGTLAGPKTLEHLVDAVLSFEGERFHAQRVVRALKNRFGPAHELGVFEMTGSGLVEVANPSALYLGTGAGSRPGSVVLAGVEGTRPLLLEVQALTVEAKYGSPRRTAIGFDGTRLALLLAVLERHGGLKLASHDVFLNVAGGAESVEPAADLAVCAAVAGSLRGRALAPGTFAFGEVGLLGEVRAVSDAALRLKEAVSLGLKTALVPAGNAGEAAAFPDLAVVPLRSVEELLART